MIRDQLAASLHAALSSLEVLPLPETINLERPARREHGDWSSNVALAAGKRAGWNPSGLAGELAGNLTAELPPHVISVEIAGPGFVNFRLADSWLHDVLVDVIDQGVKGYARATTASGTRVMVEFVSANPTGPLHAGHGRGAAYGDSLARILERCGHEVTRESYLNDRGVQMQKFIDSLEARRRGEEPPADGYHGQYVIDWAGDIPENIVERDELWEWGEARAVEDHREVLARMNVHFDHWFSERSMVESGAIDTTLADLRERGVVYDSEGAVWLRSTDYGDDKDRVLV